MARVNSAEMTGTIAALGIIIERPNLTVSEVAQELDKRFPRCRFASSTAHNVVPQLARGGHSRARARCTYRHPGEERSLDRYEATWAGIQAFHSWMHERPSGKPTLRDALYGRIELCRLEDVPHLVRMAEEEARIASDLYSTASTKLRREIDKTRAGAKKSHLQEVREVLLYVDPMHWSERCERYETIAERLREIAGDAGIVLFEPLND